MAAKGFAWSSRKQPLVTLSTTTAKFTTTTTCVCQEIWMRIVLKMIRYSKKGSTIVKCDDNSSIKISKNPVMHGRSKHIDCVIIFGGTSLRMEL